MYCVCSSCFFYIKAVSARLLTSEGIMYIKARNMVRPFNVKLTAIQSTYYMVKSYRFKFPNFRIGPCGISSAYRAHFPPLIVRARVRIIPCGFRSIWCGNSAVNGAEIPHDRCISAAYRAEIPHGPIRKLASICSSKTNYPPQSPHPPKITPCNVLTCQT